MSSTAPGVTVGAAAKIAMELTQLSASTGMTVDALMPLYTEALDNLLEVMTARTDQPPTMSATPPGFNAQTSLENNLGATLMPQTGAPVVVAPPQAVVPGQVQPVVAAAATFAPMPSIPGAGGGEDEENWKVFFADIDAGTFANNWDDNRPKKAEGGKFATIPDFKHKSWQRPGAKYPVGIYLNDKKAPAWVDGRLAQVGLK